MDCWGEFTATTSSSEENQATMELQGLDAVDPAMREPIRRYAEHVRKHAGEKALGLTLFGAIAAGSFDAGKQAAANVLVLDAIDLEVLKRLAAEGHKFGNLGIAAPLVMTPDFIRALLDTFPLGSWRSSNAASCCSERIFSRRSNSTESTCGCNASAN